MSDVVRCPLCQKYFDNTFTVTECPKCGGNLAGVEIPTDIPREEIVKTQTSTTSWLIVAGCTVVYFLMTGNPFQDMNRLGGGVVLGRLMAFLIVTTPAIIVAFIASRKEDTRYSWGIWFLSTWIMSFVITIILVVVVFSYFHYPR